MALIFTGSHVTSSIVFLVLRMPGRDFFILPLCVAGNGERYLLMRSAFMSGMSLTCLLLFALRSIVGGKLKNVWCMYFGCCCLYVSMYIQEAAVCYMVLVFVARRRWSVLSHCTHCVGLIGMSHRSVVGQRPPTRASFVLVEYVAFGFVEGYAATSRAELPC